MTIRSLHELPAPAKLNLFLHVLGRRDDGYHRLQSAFVLIDWGDTLQIERRGDGVLQRRDLGAALPADDLCLRAARSLQQASGTSFGAEISIDKRVPWGAGLGGGSSDAATVLLALNRLWGLNWPRAALLPLALALGADVPFFVGGRNAWVEGVGERLTPIDLPRARYAVLKPAEPLSTAAVFAHPAVGRSAPAAILLGSFENARGGQPRLEAKAPQAVDRQLVYPADIGNGFGRNDLQAAAEALSPEVAQAAAMLTSRFGNCRMTGSGSAVFARVGAPCPPEATFPAADLPPGWVGRMCRSLDQHPLIGWAG